MAELVPLIMQTDRQDGTEAGTWSVGDLRSWPREIAEQMISARTGRLPPGVSLPRRAPIERAVVDSAERAVMVGPQPRRDRGGG